MNPKIKSAYDELKSRGFDKVIMSGGFAWIAKRDFYTFLIMLLVICDLNQPAYFIMLTGASFVGIGGLIALSIRAIRHRGKPKSPEAAPSPETNPK